MSINSLQSFFRLSRQTFSTRTPQRLLCVPTTYLSTKHSYPLEGTRTEAVLVKKPGDREILELVDLERTNPGVQSNECAAPPGIPMPVQTVQNLTAKNSACRNALNRCHAETER